MSKQDERYSSLMCVYPIALAHVGQNKTNGTGQKQDILLIRSILAPSPRHCDAFLIFGYYAIRLLVLLVIKLVTVVVGLSLEIPQQDVVDAESNGVVPKPLRLGSKEDPYPASEHF